MLELLFVLGFFLMLMVTRLLAGHSDRAGCSDCRHVPGRNVRPDDQAVTVATAGGGCGVGDQSSKNAKNPSVSAQ